VSNNYEVGQTITIEPAPPGTPNEYGWDDEMDAESNLTQLLGMCGCGEPTEVMRLFLRSLDRMDCNRVRQEYTLELIENFPGFDSSPLDYPIVWAHLYQLDHLGLIEHGGTVWCGWMTDKGVFVRNKLREYLTREEAPAAPG
jgi:hypothetical protein